MNQFEKDLENKSVEGIVALHSNSSVVSWFGPADYDSGKILDNLTTYYGGLMSANTNYNQATLSNLTIMELAPHVINASFSLLLQGSEIGGGLGFHLGTGAFNYTIYVEQQWVNQGGNWVIQRESWDFLSLWIQYPLT